MFNTGWRSKTFRVWLSPKRRLIITLRRFKIQKAYRSGKYRQLILPTFGGLTREIAVRYKYLGRRSNSRLSRFSAVFFSVQVRPRAVVSIILLIVGLSGISYTSYQLIKGHKLLPAKTYATSIPAKAERIKPIKHSIPTRVSIPSVGIDAKTVVVGQDGYGSIEMPPLFDWSTGWYKYSPTPGELGPAIIVGHVDTYKGASVFWSLRNVMPGDLIYIKRQDGGTVKFKVQALKQFSQANFPTQQVYGNLNYPGLRLITCGGAFNKSTASYTQNTVVYAFMVT